MPGSWWRICQQWPFQTSHKHLSRALYQESWLWARRWALRTLRSSCQPTLYEATLSCISPPPCSAVCLQLLALSWHHVLTQIRRLQLSAIPKPLPLLRRWMGRQDPEQTDQAALSKGLDHSPPQLPSHLNYSMWEASTQRFTKLLQDFVARPDLDSHVYFSGQVLPYSSYSTIW